ncbi:hypothetical protein ACVFI8_21480 [Agarivorans sp. MS3-6]
MEFGYTINSGSVDASANFLASAVLPSNNPAEQEFFNLNPNSQLAGGEISTQSPEAEAYISAIAELSGSVTGTACLIANGCMTGSAQLPTIDVNQKIIVLDPNSLKILPDLPAPLPDPLAELSLLNQALTLEGTLTPIATAPFVAPGFKLSTAFGTIVDTTPTGTPELEVEVASIEAQLPNISTSGGVVGNMITSSGRDDIIKARIDLDGIASMYGIPPLGLGLSLVDIAGFKIGARFDALDIDAGPDLGITQDFELSPTLMVNLAFSNPILIAGLEGLHSSWQGQWDMLPSFALLKSTTFSPTFWLDTMLTNSLGLDLGLTGTMDLFKLGAGVSVAGIDLLSIGPISLNEILGFGNELFSTDKLLLPIVDNSFVLSGFNDIKAASFTIGVPEPTSILLFVCGLIPLLFVRHRKVRRLGEQLIC